MKKILLLFCFLFSLSLHAVTTINVTTAGTLTTLISAQDKATITNLTLTGNIDARDVKCMRDEMPLLARLDMSEVSIQEYIGTAGTAMSSSSYPANEMPESSFKLNNISNDYLKEFYFPNSITSIGESALDGCNRLTNIVIPEKVTTIHLWAFRSCFRLLNIAIPASVSTIGNNSFRFCSSNIAFNVASDNPYYSSMDGVLFNKDKTVLISFPEGREGEYIVPNSVTSIANAAFFWCHLQNITIPNTIITIGSSAFNGSYNLTKVTIPAFMLTLAAWTFSYCDKLSIINIPSTVINIEEGVFYKSGSAFMVDLDNPNYASVDGVLFDKNKAILIQFPVKSNISSYSIPKILYLHCRVSHLPNVEI